jgi:hypothetical protein
MGKPKYTEITKTELGRSVHDKWCQMRKKFPCSPTFQNFINFYEWAIATGYTGEELLFRKDKTLPYSEDNCYWNIPTKTNKGGNAYYKGQAESWNRTVNAIRKAYGMPPLETKEESEE